ncbi:MAG: adenylyl-sulfate kinase, partial [Chloroflexi bacterium]|nr:adenylyl-sulfate kinase [Chloroflexota bacterium]
YAFLFDAFLEEQEQGITIDTARRFFSWQNRRYIIIDAPGHKEFLKNMVSGASRADAALLVIDALEGVREQSKRHAYILSLLGVPRLAVVVTKMDLVDYRQEIFDTIERDYGRFLSSLGLVADRFVPVSARHGENVAVSNGHMPWYTGPTVLETLGLFDERWPLDREALRFPVQDVYKFDERRIIAGRLTSGRLAAGDRVVFWPSGKAARVRRIEAFNVPSLPAEAMAGQSVGFTLDEQIFVERGEIASHEEMPPLVANGLRCQLFWMGGRPLELGGRYSLRLATREVECEVTAIHRVIDAVDLAAATGLSAVAPGQAAELTLHTKRPIAFDRYQDFGATGRFVLVDGYDVSGGGIVAEALAGTESVAEHPLRAAVPLEPDDRARRFGHLGALVVVVAASAESALAVAGALERHLVAEGRHAFLLEPSGSGGRAGAGSAEGLPLAGHARLLTAAGLIVIAAGVADLQGGASLHETMHPAPVMEVRLGNFDTGAPGMGGLRLPHDAEPQFAAAAIAHRLRVSGVLLPETEASAPREERS